jgi:hypothetical protein
MTISVNYQKRKNVNLFNKFQTNKVINLSSVQNYIPIYDRFFSLNSTNFNSINLNHKWHLSDIKDHKNNNIEDERVFYCKLKNINEDEDLTNSQKVFFKMAPLLDPYKYLVGKYNHNDNNLFNLPSFDNSIKIHPKIADSNNSSYIDGFFSYLTSKTLHEHNFLHGLDYYGSFLAIKNEYKIDIIDDLDYLIQSDFFNKQQNILFKVEDYTHLITNNEITQLVPLKISTSLKSNFSIKSIDESLFENIFELNNEISLSLDDVKNMKVELEDITHSNEFDIKNQKKTETLKSGSSCSSRTSHTNDDDLSDLDNKNDSVEETISKHSGSGSDAGSKNSDSDPDSNSDSDLNSDFDCEEETLTLTFPKFPVQVICMEHCENTFDNLIINNELKEEEWFSALMQIIMILITYQKMFSFTHNDLHTNNIMYVSTNKKFLYYVYKKKTYKVPTFGKIYKIIDFGRAIYKFNGKIFCSDSFQNGGAAATQYNTEPYFNDKKPRLEPNFSFDLCRLACSIFDYVIEDFDMIKNLTSPQNELSSLIKIIIDWCLDDNGINVLYKNNGVERYPDFKLYKMIARYVHKHTPIAQLDRPEFSKFIILNKSLPKSEHIINIDDLPCYC